ncbi:MAG: LutC/YkgG family protein [Phototrophicaceae bacterium]
MPTSRDLILNRLRATRRPFPDAAPRPAEFLPVTLVDDDSPDGLLTRFEAEVIRLNGEVYPVDGDAAAAECLLMLLDALQVREVCAWHFKHIPVRKLATTLREAGVRVVYPNIHQDADARQREIERLEKITVGLTGADAVAAATGTLIVSAGPGKSRIPTALPPVHIAIVRQSQIVPRIESWLAHQRHNGSADLLERANICFITGPSRTADIEKQLVLGVHGPRHVKVIVVR